MRSQIKSPFVNNFVDILTFGNLGVDIDPWYLFLRRKVKTFHVSCIMYHVSCMYVHVSCMFHMYIMDLFAIYVLEV
jgi:hypothetical protein